MINRQVVAFLVSTHWKKTTQEIEESNPYMKFWRNRVIWRLGYSVQKWGRMDRDRQAKISANECWWALIGFNTERTNLPGNKPNRSVKIFNVKSVNQDRSRRQILVHVCFLVRENKARNFMRIVCKQMILMKYQVLFGFLTLKAPPIICSRRQFQIFRFFKNNK